MEKLTLTIQDILKIQDYKPLNRSECDLMRPIKGKTIVRLGLQISGSFGNAQVYSGYLIGWGTNEYHYFKTLDPKAIKKKIASVINKHTPAIILSQGFRIGRELNALIAVAEQNKIPVYKLDMHMTDVLVLFHNIITNQLKNYSRLHASFVVINDVGVLIRGPSGIGKSEAVLEIVQRGHIFIGDDAIEVYLNGNNVFGRASSITKDLLEVRGIGLINIPFIYGKQAVANSARVDLVVDLVGENSNIEFDRLGTSNLIEKVLGRDIVKILIPIKPGRSMASLIIAAASVFAAKKEGMDPLKTIKSRRN